MTTGGDDAWVWWALAGGVLAATALAVSIAVHRRQGAPRYEKAANIVAAVAAAWTLVALVLMLA